MTAAPVAWPRRAHIPGPAGRRRISDPTRDPESLSAYKARSGRMFPTWSEVLEVLRDLGYEKVGEAGAR